MPRGPQKITPQYKMECLFDGCNKPRSAKGYCGGHHKQLSEGRELTELRRVGKRIKEGDWVTRAKFALDQYLQPDPNGCIIWAGSIHHSSGYGHLLFEGATWLAHRLSYCIAHGSKDIIGHETIHHICNNRLCVNPEHLEKATMRENVGEMLARRSYERTILQLQEENIFQQQLIEELREKIKNETTCPCKKFSP